MDIRKVIAKRIRLARVERDMSQGDLGRLLQVDQGVVSKIEHGTVDVRATTLERLARALNKPIAYFFESFNENTPTEDPKVKARTVKHKNLSARNL